MEFKGREVGRGTQEATGINRNIMEFKDEERKKGNVELMELIET